MKELDSFIFMRPMRDLPKNKEEIDKLPKVYHFVLTGWKNQYNLKHSNYFKIPYSSHSSKDELLQFIKNLKPKNLVFNL
jgi:hypothetical protein